MAGLPVSLKHLQDEKQFVDWGTYQRLFANVHAHLGDDGIRKIGRQSFREPPWNWVGGAVRACLNPGALWKIAVNGLSKSLYPCLDISVAIADHGTMELRLVFPPDLPISFPLAVAFQGQAHGVGDLFGLSVIETRIEPRADGFVICAEYPPHVPRLKRWGRTMTAAFSARQAADGLFRAEAELVDQLRALKLEVQERKAAQQAYAEEVAASEALAKQVETMQRLESIGLLAGGVAHDFNNLLVVMMGITELMQNDSELPDRTRDNVNQLSATARRAAHLTRQLLSFGRRQVVQPRNIDLNDAINQFQDVLSKLIPESIQLEFLPGEGPHRIHADIGQLEQVIMNLCVNARDACSASGRISIKTSRINIDAAYVETHPWASTGRYISVRISDNGAGMTPEVRDKIFDPFFTTKGEGSGTGLGMSVVHGIVKQHEGFLDVYSEPNVGTTLNVYFPQAKDPPASETDPTPVSELGGSENILFVEDDAAVRELTRKVLADAGYAVTTVTDGRAALDLFTENPNRFDLVLLDVILPGLSGPDVEAKLRSIKHQIPILFTSGYSPRGVHEGFVLDKGVDYLAKPYGPKELLFRVRSAFERS